MDPNEPLHPQLREALGRTPWVEGDPDFKIWRRIHTGFKIGLVLPLGISLGAFTQPGPQLAMFAFALVASLIFYGMIWVSAFFVYLQQTGPR